MDFLQLIANNHFAWKFYAYLSIILSLLLSICNFPRFLNEFKKDNLSSWKIRFEKYGYAIRFTIYDYLQILFGFFLIFIDIQLLNFIVFSKSKTAIIVAGIILIVCLFYSFFCISGRGMEVLNRVIIDPGVKVIHIGLKGITIKIGHE